MTEVVIFGQCLCLSRKLGLSSLDKNFIHVLKMLKQVLETLRINLLKNSKLKSSLSFIKVNTSSSSVQSFFSGPLFFGWFFVVAGQIIFLEPSQYLIRLVLGSRNLNKLKSVDLFGRPVLVLTFLSVFVNLLWTSCFFPRNSLSFLTFSNVCKSYVSFCLIFDFSKQPQHVQFLQQTHLAQ